ncbi:hypothetical protein QYM46_05115 [Brevibacterium sp. K11IcPPYGO002]|uniref:hypothetical protein n=1 Tax=Brevibacterium sp. K11IcPPYGO002 TaxID=3058837 RepID=UPI003D814D37
MSDDFSFIYSEQFRDHLKSIRQVAMNTPQVRSATQAALAASRAVGPQSVASAYMRTSTPVISRDMLATISKANATSTRAIVDGLVGHLRMNPPVAKFAAVPASTLPALSRMVATSTVVGSQFDTSTIQALFEQVRRAPPKEEEDVPPELAGVVNEEFESIPESDRQTLTPQQVRLIKEVVRNLVISALVCLYLTAQEGSDLFKQAADLLGLWAIFDRRVSTIADRVVDWAAAPEGKEDADDDES